MWKSIGIAIVSLASAAAQADARLTATENRWLSAGSAVLDYAEEQSLALDIVVQPKPDPGAAPLAMGFDNGRCKLVLSLRGNPDAESVLAVLAPAQADLAIEVMVAHEVAHCWRYTKGAGVVPAGFSSGPAQARQEMQQTRREEGFADLVGLAWASQQHPQQYARLQSWLQQVRESHAAPGSHHDTRLWVRLARDGSVFGTDRTPFEQARAVWTRGLAVVE